MPTWATHGPVILTHEIKHHTYLSVFDKSFDVQWAYTSLKTFCRYRKLIYSFPPCTSPKPFKEKVYHTLSCRRLKTALVSVAQLERHPVNLKAAGSIPGQDTHLACGLGPWPRCTWEAANLFLSHIDVSLLLSLPSFPSL